MACESMRLKEEAGFEMERLSRERESFGSKKFTQGTKEQWQRYKDLFEQYYQEKNPDSEPVEYVSPQDLSDKFTTEEEATVNRSGEVVELTEFFNYYDKDVRADIELEDGSTISVVKDRITLNSEGEKQDLGPTEHVHADNPFEYLPIVIVGEPIKAKLNQAFKEKESLIPLSPVKGIKFVIEDVNTSSDKTPPRIDGNAAKIPQVTVDMERTWPSVTVDQHQIWPAPAEQQTEKPIQQQQKRALRNTMRRHNQ